jgi:hypothetical protein
VELLRTAARESRIVAGVLLVAVAFGIGLYDERDAKHLADRDFALCGTAPVTGCTSREAPVSTGWTESSGNAFRKVWRISVVTGPHTTVSVSGLRQEQVAPFAAEGRAELRYHDGRLAAIAAADGTTIKVPFALTRRTIVLGILAAVLFLAGGGLLAWGFARINNRPRPPRYPASP